MYDVNTQSDYSAQSMTKQLTGSENMQIYSN